MKHTISVRFRNAPKKILRRKIIQSFPITVNRPIDGLTDALCLNDKTTHSLRLLTAALSGRYFSTIEL